MTPHANAQTHHSIHSYIVYNNQPAIWPTIWLLSIVYGCDDACNLCVSVEQPISNPLTGSIKPFLVQCTASLQVRDAISREAARLAVWQRNAFLYRYIFGRERLQVSVCMCVNVFQIAHIVRHGWFGNAYSKSNDLDGTQRAYRVRVSSSFTHTQRLIKTSLG